MNGGPCNILSFSTKKELKSQNRCDETTKRFKELNSATHFYEGRNTLTGYPVQM